MYWTGERGGGGDYVGQDTEGEVGCMGQERERGRYVGQEREREVGFMGQERERGRLCRTREIGGVYWTGERM